jgi:hypothetical protein
MIKLITLLREAFADYYSKNKWIELPLDVIQHCADNIADLVSTAYAAKGGNFEIRNGEDVKNSDIKYWVAQDIDDDPEADVVVGGKKTAAGTKMTMIGQDGSSAAKKLAITKMIDLMKKNGFYAEMDPDLAEKFALPFIKDEATIRKVLNKDVEMNPDGSYSRMVSGVHKHVKVLVGIPRV